MKGYKFIRPWQPDDAKSLAKNADNIKVWNNLRDTLPKPYSEQDAINFITFAIQQKPANMMAIVIDDKAVGSIGITLKSDVERITAELGYFIGEPCWGRGVTTAAVREMVRYAFENFPVLKKIYATPFGFNIASQRVLEKAGFTKEAILRKVAIKNGNIEDEHYYAIFRDE